MVRSQAASEYEIRWGSPRPKAPFLKGDGGAQAPTGDCRIPAAAKGRSLLRHSDLPAHVCDELLGRWAFARAGHHCPELLRFRVWVLHGHFNRKFDFPVNLIRRYTVLFCHKFKHLRKRIAHAFPPYNIQVENMMNLKRVHTSHNIILSF